MTPKDPKNGGKIFDFVEEPTIADEEYRLYNNADNFDSDNFYDYSNAEQRPSDPMKRDKMEPGGAPKEKPKRSEQNPFLFATPNVAHQRMGPTLLGFAKFNPLRPMNKKRA